MIVLDPGNGGKIDDTLNQRLILVELLSFIETFRLKTMESPSVWYGRAVKPRATLEVIGSEMPFKRWECDQRRWITDNGLVNSLTAIVKIENNGRLLRLWSQPGYSQKIIIVDGHSYRPVGTVEITATGGFYMTSGLGCNVKTDTWPLLWHTQAVTMLSITSGMIIRVMDLQSFVRDDFLYRKNDYRWHVPEHWRQVDRQWDLPEAPAKSKVESVEKSNMGRKPLNDRTNADAVITNDTSEHRTTREIESKHETQTSVGTASGHLDFRFDIDGVLRESTNTAPHQNRMSEEMLRANEAMAREFEDPILVPVEDRFDVNRQDEQGDVVQGMSTPLPDLRRVREEDPMRSIQHLRIQQEQSEAMQGSMSIHAEYLAALGRQTGTIPKMNRANSLPFQSKRGR